MDDTTAACNMINTIRKLGRKRSKRWFHKSITIRLSIEHKRQLSFNIMVVYDPKTDSVAVVACLKYCRHSVFPGTNQSRNCHSQHGIDILHASRARNQEYRDTHKEELKASQRAYYVAHKEERNERRRAYQAAHKEELNARARERYAAKKSSPRECYFEPEAR